MCTSIFRNLATTFKGTFNTSEYLQHKRVSSSYAMKRSGCFAMEMRRPRMAKGTCEVLAFLSPDVGNRILRSTNLVSTSRNCFERGTHVLPPRRKASFSILPNRKALHAQASAGSFNHAGGSVILVVDHGSRRKEANEMLSEVGGMLQGKTELPVYTAHMELASPSISDGVDKCVKEGATHIIVVPFFLSPGRHSTKDIPQMTADAVANHPGVSFDVRPPIGTHPGIIDVILDRAGLLGSVQK